jgi:acid phosphatase
MPNIGNRLDDAGINWRWYSGGWNDALANNETANTELFQFHHQPFAYYTKYAPFLVAPTTDYSATNPPKLNPATTGPNAHLQDEEDFLDDVASGNLPPVAFVKPIGKNNEHPGYTDEVTGQQHVADLVAAVQQSSIWKDCVIIITYDENGGRWDHVPLQCEQTNGEPEYVFQGSLFLHSRESITLTARNMKPFRYSS